MIITEELQNMLALLEYSPKWLEYGFLEEARLRQQVAIFQTSNDHNTEHYRYSTFREILQTRASLTDPEIDRYIELAQTDADATAMGTSALCELLLWNSLTNEQFDKLSFHPAFAAPVHRKLITRWRLSMALENPTLTQEIFDQCLAFQSDSIQRQLLQHPDLSIIQLETLALQGATRAIRNIAAEMTRAKGRRRDKR